MYKENALLVGLDIGTYKTAVIVAEVIPDGIEVLGIGMALSQGGLRKGLIINVETTVQAIRKAVEEAQLGASCEIHNVCAGVGGGHTGGVTSHGMVVVKDREVSPTDVASVIEVARTVALPAECEILHVLPQEFLVDGQERGREPVGMSGIRLEGSVHLVTVANGALDSIRRCCERAGLHVNSFQFAALAAAEAVLTPEEKDMGVTLVDIGGGTTGIAIFSRGAVVHTAVLPVGGHNMTNDLAVGMRIPIAEAEKMKQRHGCALGDLITPGEMVEMPKVGGRDPSPVPRRRLGDIIEPRAEEILTLVREQCEAVEMLGKLGAGVVLTGGGAITEGMSELAERVFKVPVRRGVPRFLGSLVDAVNGPMYATAVGLVLHESQQPRLNGVVRHREGPGWGRVRERVVEWFREFF